MGREECNQNNIVYFCEYFSQLGDTENAVVDIRTYKIHDICNVDSNCVGIIC